MEAESGNKVVTGGLNPHFTTDEQFLAACALVRQHFPLSTFHFPLFFYGSGCGSEQQRERVAALLFEAFGTSDMHVETDMLGACRAVCGRDNGLVGILGTGSNACYYDGDRIALQAVSTGYVLGDHGSANHVGRRLLQDYLTGLMPRNLMGRFHETYPMTKDDFLEAVYHQPNGNRFLASLAKFAVEHIEDDYCSSEILISLYEWYSYQLEGLQKLSFCDRLYLTGGFAARIKPLLDAVAKDKGLVIKEVLADPIDGLRRYHTAN
jgi:N-acetylglucosamine kinase-like BadF-type ATPase